MKTFFLANLIYYVVKLLSHTYRFEFIGSENKSVAKNSNSTNTYIYALWHQNLLSAIFSHINEKFSMVISESKDGELVAVTCKKFGHLPARGSSTRGGKKALIEIVRNIKNGFPGALTVDGPTGPEKIVKHGIIEIAKLTQSPILPLSPYAENFWIIKKSWDQFRIPKPFSKIIIVIGKPVWVEKELSKDRYDDLGRHIQNQINDGELTAMRYLNI